MIARNTSLCSDLIDIEWLMKLRIDKLLRIYQGPYHILFGQRIESVDWNIYPNPATTSVQLLGPSGMEFIIRNAFGQIIFTGKTSGTITHIDSALLSSGVYFVEMGGSLKRVVKM